MKLFFIGGTGISAIEAVEHIPCESLTKLALQATILILVIIKTLIDKRTKKDKNEKEQ